VAPIHDRMLPPFDVFGRTAIGREKGVSEKNGHAREEAIVS